MPGLDGQVNLVLAARQVGDRRNEPVGHPCRMGCQETQPRQIRRRVNGGQQFGQPLGERRVGVPRLGGLLGFQLLDTLLALGSDGDDLPFGGPERDLTAPPKGDGQQADGDMWDSL